MGSIETRGIWQPRAKTRPAPRLAQHRAYRRIRGKLLEGNLPPGRRISARALARELGLGRTPVREAIRQLEAEGLMRRVTLSGSRARTYTRQLTDDELRDLLDVRIALESYAAEQAAQHMTPKTLQTLREMCAAMREMVKEIHELGPQERNSPFGRRSTRLEMAFHSGILDASGNRLGARIVENFHILTALFGHYLSVLPPLELRGMAADCRDHERILAALESADPKRARAAMRRHLRKAKKFQLAARERCAGV